jgi:hypothetical protein
MIDFLTATALALALSGPMTVAMGLVYYMIAVAAMNAYRRIWGDGHTGYCLISLVAIAIVATFLLLFSFFARSF